MGPWQPQTAKYDEEVDALYITLDSRAQHWMTIDLRESEVLLDLDVNGEVSGIEVLSPPLILREKIAPHI